MELMYIKFMNDIVLGNLQLNFAHDYHFEFIDNELRVIELNMYNIFKEPIRQSLGYAFY